MKHKQLYQTQRQRQTGQSQFEQLIFSLVRISICLAQQTHRYPADDNIQIKAIFVWKCVFVVSKFRFPTAYRLLHRAETGFLFRRFSCFCVSVIGGEMDRLYSVIFEREKTPKTFWKLERSLFSVDHHARYVHCPCS